MKVIASDFDGTFSREGGILQSDLDAVSRWREAGNLFGFSTGRCFGSIYKKAKNMTVDFFVCSGGAAVYSGEGDLIWEDPFTFEVFMEAMEIAKDYDMPYIDLAYGRKIWELRYRYAQKPFPEDVTLLHHAAFSCASPEIAQKLSADIAEKMSSRALGQWNHMNVDLVSPGVTKTTGITEYIKLMGVDKNDVITVGDNYNDIEMIRDFNGYAVEGAVDELKKAAKGVYSNFTDLVNDHI